MSDNKSDSIIDLDCDEGLSEYSGDIKNASGSFKDRINADPDKVEQGLAKLVLTLINLLRKLMEKQAMRRIENDTVNDEEIEKLGEAFMNLEIKMQELVEAFDLTEEDLNLNLGPLGDLM